MLLLSQSLPFKNAEQHSGYGTPALLFMKAAGAHEEDTSPSSLRYDINIFKRSSDSPHDMAFYGPGDQLKHLPTANVCWSFKIHDITSPSLFAKLFI